MSKGKILVVDDEIYIVHILDFSLGMEGYEVITALDGEQALEKVKNEKPDLIVLDIMMQEHQVQRGHAAHSGDPPLGQRPERRPEAGIRRGRGRLHHEAVQPAQAGRAHQPAAGTDRHRTPRSFGLIADGSGRPRPVPQ